MPVAVGMIETYGFPAVLAAADAMLKAGNVTLVKYESCTSGHYIVSIRGGVAEVRRAMEAGISMVETLPGSAEVTAHYIVPHPTANLEAVLPIDYTEASEPYRT